MSAVRLGLGDKAWGRGRLLVVVPLSAMAGMADAELSNVRAVAGSDLVEAYDEALLVMARPETGDSSMTLDEAERWYHGQRAARGEGPSRLGTIAAPTAAGRGSRWRSDCRPGPGPRPAGDGGHAEPYADRHHRVGRRANLILRGMRPCLACWATLIAPFLVTLSGG